MRTLWERFKHRNIAKIATAYAVVGWIMLQVIEIVLPTFNAPQWIAQTIIFVVIMGFPIALLIAWASEIKSGRYEKDTGEGTSDSAVGNKKAAEIPKRLFYGVGAASLSVIGLFAFYVSTVLFSVDQPSQLSNIDDVETTTLNAIPAYRSAKFELNLSDTGFHPGLGFRTELTISPNGENLVFQSYTQTGLDIFIKNLLSLDPPRRLVSINRSPSYGRPFFSSDGEWVFYNAGTTLHRIRVEGGAPQDIGINVFSWGGAHYEDAILTSRGSGQLTKNNILGEVLGEIDSDGIYIWPAFLPGGTHALVTRLAGRDNVQSGRIEVLDLENMTSTPLIETAYNAKYAASGHIVFARDSALWAVPFDVATMQLIGDQALVLPEMESDGRRGTALYTFSERGRLIYLRGTNTAGSASGRTLTTIGRDGDLKSLAIEPQRYGHLELSPDGRDLAVTIYTDDSGSDVWVLDLEREIFGRRTFDGLSSKAIWSPDGRDLIYSSAGSGMQIVSADGTGQAETIFPSAQEVWPSSVSLDGEVVFAMGSPPELYMLSLQSNAGQEVTATELDVAPEIVVWHGSTISPNGDFLAYASMETGNNQVYVRPFPNVADGKWQASIEPGFQPLWSPIENELLYWTQDHRQVSVPFQIETQDEEGSQSSLRFSRPNEMFSVVGVRQFETMKAWDYLAESEQFFMITYPIEEETPQEEVMNSQTVVTVVENWFEELASLAPADPDLIN